MWPVGAIKSLTVRNWMSYTESSTIHFSPSTNIILAGNGSGKSALVSAIAIGLGFRPDLLGRSTDLSSFVQRGKSEARIELVMAREGGKFTTVTRTIHVQEQEEGRSKMACTTTWEIDHEKKKKEDITNLQKELRIQVNNLNNFLPQDRVGQFAKMKPEDRFSETLRATNDDLHMTFEKMKERRDRMNERSWEVERIRKAIETYKAQKRSLQNAVNIYEQQKELRRKISLCEKKISELKLRNAERLMEEIQEKRDELLRGKMEVERKIEPIKEEKQKLSEELKSLEREYRKSDAQRGRVEERCVELTNDLESLDDDIAQLNDEEKRLQREAVGQKRRADKLRRDLEKDNVEIQSLESEQSVNEELLAKTNESITGFKEESDEIDQQLAGLSQSISRNKTEKEHQERLCVERFHDLTAYFYNKDHKRRMAENCMKAYEHKAGGGFKDEVYGPLGFLVKLRECCPEYVQNYIETLLSKHLHEFIFRSTEDSKKINQDFLLPSLSVPPVYKRTPDWDTKLEKYGCIGYLVDFVEDPPECPCLCSVLNNHYNFNEIAVFDRYLTAEDEKVVKGLLTESIRSLRGGGKSTVIKFLCQKREVIFSQSRYFSQSYVDTNEIKDGMFFRKSSFWSLQERKTWVIGEIKREEEMISRLKTQRDSLKDKIAAENVRAQAAKAASRKLAYLRKQQEDRINELRTIEESLRSTGGNLGESDSTKAKKRNLAEKKLEILFNLLTIADSRQKSQEILRELLVRCQDAENAYERNQEVLRPLDEQLRSKVKDLEKHRREVDRVHVELIEAKRTVAELVITEEDRGQFSQIPNDEDDLEHEMGIVEQQAKNCVLEPHKLDEYRRLEKIIEREEKGVDTFSEQLNEEEKVLKGMYDQWWPDVQQMHLRLTRRFSRFLRSIGAGCHGHIDLDVPVDSTSLKEYKINICIAFKESENPIILEAGHHSGGQKSLATMLYMLSLQDLSTGSFRVLDEINQGLDPVNERNLLNLVFKVADPNFTLALDEDDDAGDEPEEAVRCQYIILSPHTVAGVNYYAGGGVACEFPFNGPQHGLSTEEVNEQRTIRKRSRRFP